MAAGGEGIVCVCVCAKVSKVTINRRVRTMRLIQAN